MFAEFVRWTESSWLGNVGRDVFWLFPAAETVHFFGLCLLMGAMLLIDLRLLGLGKRHAPIDAVLSLIPVALIGLLLNLASGIVFLCAHPENYWWSTAFRIKLAVIALGGANAVWFKFREAPRIAGIGVGIDVDTRTKVVAALSLLIWIAVIVLGRFLPFVSKSSS